MGEITPDDQGHRYNHQGPYKGEAGGQSQREKIHVWKQGSERREDAGFKGGGRGHKAGDTGGL